MLQLPISSFLISSFVGLNLLFCSTAFAASAEKSAVKLKEFGEYTVHFNAFSSDTLQPKIAKIYGITRSKNRGILVISILKNTAGPLGKAVKAEVTVHANNLTGQMKSVAIREIDDSGAIYYVSEFRVAHKEILNFTVEVIANSTGKPMEVKFRQQFYTN